LPDGEVVKVGRERFLAPEILMNPGIAGIESDGCGEMIFKSINVLIL
jgi:actin-related protein 2